VFERSWRDILWNHHHDTLTGTSIHASYELSHQVLRRAIESDRRILDDALAHLAARVKRPEAPEGRAVLVFNTLAWRRDAVVEIENDTTFYPPGGLVAAAPSGETTPVQFSGNRRFLFVARDLPACGYRVYVIRPRTEAEAPKAVAAVKDRGTKLAGGRFELEIDPAKGTITRLRDTQLNRDWITPDKPGNKLVSYLEKPHGMSAWVIGDFAGAEEPEDGRALVPKLEQKAWEEGPVRAGVKLERRYRKSTIRQEILVYRDLDRIDFQLEVEWNERGGDGKPSPFLKVEFPIAVANPKARYEVPFGSLERAMGSKEQPALQWADLSGDGGGVALLNDCKHGYQAKDGTLRLSLLRSSYEPDHEPDLGRHVIRYALVPHAGGIHEAGVPKKGYEFNHKPLAVWVGGVSSPRSDAAAPALPAERSFLEVTGDGVIPTALKLAEDDNDWIVRFYQSSGTPATAKVATPFAVKSAQAVNFLEDPQGPADPAAVPLRGFEIKTLKLKAE
jgi:alpha-mannosidase